MTALFALCISVIAWMPATPAGDPSATPSPVATAAPTASPPAPVASASPLPALAWLGATLGEAPSDLRTSLGRPREIISTNVGDIWRYDADGGNVTLEVVVNQDKVASITARQKFGKHSALADPLGGAIGMTAAALQTARGAPGQIYDNGDEFAYVDASGIRYSYSIDGGIVTGISIFAPLPPPPPAQVVSDAAHDGSTLGRAFIVKASTQTEATNAELTFLHSLVCGDGGTWQLQTQEDVAAGGGHFDLFHVVCSANKALHDFYFDVSQSYGHQ